ncbi:hypothetical protein E0F15_20520 [Frankia sp. B2]|uniref:SAM-dependent methyltransferase n=1 Tax=unclassified Frankia TaxID=2632575 RepID=UPI0006CA00BE|nr:MULTISPECIES: SAM-dependent methyltransferase [unclassified Frankia]KPM56932.1 hypothetical protein ACG83_03635 [Frankia sp. R43]TFE25108.1 hypothetical protein E0F15_20520 [Frankia sp. B2]
MTGTDGVASVGATEGPNVARVYDFFLGGAHNFPADREAAAQVERTWPQIRDTARVNRLFLGEAVSYLAGEVGVRHFLDIGSGMPTMGNVHEVAQQLAPDAQVVYVDSDPVAVAHSKILLAPNPRAVAVQADLLRPDEILDHPQVSRLLDLGQPVALLLVAVLHFFPDDTGPRHLVAQLREALPAGSHLVVTHATGDGQSQQVTEAAEVYRRTTAPFQLRDRTEVLSFFDDCTLVDPGLVLLPGWEHDRQRGRSRTAEGRLPVYAGVGRVR